ncbi:hypothetical protein GVX82_02865, partial [Patescibacteria group bacterium]|nr:hypothetical protein [Patescibacteria group bacterium]
MQETPVPIHHDEDAHYPERTAAPKHTPEPDAAPHPTPRRSIRSLDLIEGGLLALIAIGLGLTFLYTELRLRQAQTALETEVAELKENLTVVTDSFDAQLAAITDTLELTQDEN